MENLIANITKSNTKRKLRNSSAAQPSEPANNPEEYDSWLDAVRTLRKEDHYLLVMVDQVMVDQAAPSVRPPRDQLKLLGAGLAIAGVILGASLLTAKYDPALHFPSRETLALVAWVIGAGLAIVYVALRTLLGKRRTDKLFANVIERVFVSPHRRT